MRHVSHNTDHKSEAGVTLLISILVMSGLALISLTLATFTIQELRSSRAVIVTEPAIAAAESAGEQGIWAIKRSSAITTCPTETAASLNNGSILSTCKSYNSAIFELKANTPFIFYLYDPNNVNTNVDLLTPSYPYTSMTINCLSGSSTATFKITRLNEATTGLNPTTGNICPPSTSPTQVVTISVVPSTNPKTEGRMKVIISPGLTDITVSVNTNQGMPNFPTVNASGCNARVTVTSCTSSQELFSRKIQITVPQ